MKNLYKITLFFLLLGLGSCNYLDVVPDNVATIDYAFRNRTSAEKYLYTCYSFYPNVGSMSVDPAMNGGDETWMIYGIWEPYTSVLIGRGFQNSSNPLINCWDGQNWGESLWEGIRDCNIFLENIDKVPDMTSYEKKRWAAEAKFLKAYFHYYLMKSYGPIPIADVNLPISAGVDQVRVYREPVDKVATYVADLMKEATVDLPNASDVIEGTEAGRIDKLIAMSVRAEVLVFAASPLFNGNTDFASMVDNRGISLFPQTYDANKWKIAAQACKEAIDLCHAQKKGLYNLVDPLISAAPEPFKLQTTYRQAICDRWNKELIWGSTQYDFRLLQKQCQAKLMRLTPDNSYNAFSEWAPTLNMAERYYSSHGVPIDEDKEWQNNGWYNNRFKLRPEASSGEEKYYVKEGEKTVYFHYNREPRFYASLGIDKGIYFGNGYYNFPEDVKYTDFFAGAISGRIAQDGHSPTGYSAKKMHCFKNTQTYSNSSVEYFPFPLMRLADLYLLYAEALNEANGPVAEAFTYLDKVRERAGLSGVKESWQTYSTNPNKPNTKDGFRQIIHQERANELAFESKRFWDIRRWKEIETLNKQPKGWNVRGENADDFYKVLSVAAVPVKFTIKDYFWPIKESTLTVNKNLIQNYGW